MSAALYRYPVFLTEDDWKSAVTGYENRVRRFRAASRLDQAERVRSAMTEAAADCIPDGNEFRYVLHLTEEDYGFLSEAVTDRRNGVSREVVERIDHELSMAAGDATEL
ncbi:hypothetical protein ACQEVY_25290 [Streptomyces sp. CA-288835]|uniref:hypothetical protein n=1 Tax=Streptomyces sp. CA-288835 TaxID=3240069 RepID=UPI003D8B2E92